jgi:ribosomal protein S12 methylthiotransferase
LKFKIISLGCPKNLVESEYIAKRLEDAGHSLAEDYDTVVVNTCAFVSDAAKESVETILEEAINKKERGKRVVVTGCLVERYGIKLKELLPEADLFVGRGYYREIESLAEETGFFVRPTDFAETFPRKVLTAHPSTYLKIQEGCDNRCTYCTVPGIRGGLQSRPLADITAEFRWLLKEGFKEINIIGQDITSYGRKSGSSLKELLRTLVGTEGDYFLRLLYMHPRGIDEELLDLIAGSDKIIKYLDIPIQHSENSILARMGRGYTKADLDRLFASVRSAMADATIRTTVIVGFPGESEEDFTNLCDSLKDWQFDMLGAFTYSKEEGTPAAKMKGQVRKGIKKERYNRVMELQQAISKGRLARLVGRREKVIVEGREAGQMTGRLLTQAPDIDGLVFIRGDCKKGEIREGKIVKTLDYDVIVEL